MSTPLVAADGGGFAWQTAPDSQLAGYVTNPSTPQQWGGEGASSQNIYGMTGAGYNASAVGAVISSIETTCATVVECINPWGLATRLTVGLAGSYLLYRAQGWWYSWLGSDWGSTSSTGISSASWAHVTAGQSISFHDQSGNTKSWTVPSTGYLLEAGAFYGSYGNPSSVVACAYSNGHYWRPADFGAGQQDDTHCSAAYNQFGNSVTDTGYKLYGGGELYFWFRPVAAGTAPLTLSGVSTTQPSGERQNLSCASGGYEGYGCTGSAFNNANPSASAIASALRDVLSEPGNPAAYIFSCVISGDCSSTAVGTSFTMPNCYGSAPEFCLAAMYWLGFTGSLQTSIAADADYTQPAGVVLSTAPGVGAGVSTLASTIADAYTNPDSCEWIVQDPHASTGPNFPDAVDVKASATCTYATTINATLNLWKCDSEPDPDLTAVESGEWGCLPVAEATDTTRNAVPDQTEFFQAPDDDGATLISGDNKWFIAYGTLDLGTPEASWSQAVQIP